MQVEWEEAQSLARLHMQRESDRAADEADLREDPDTEEDESTVESEPYTASEEESKQSEPSAAVPVDREKKEGNLYIVMIRYYLKQCAQNVAKYSKKILRCKLSGN